MSKESVYTYDGHVIWVNKGLEPADVCALACFRDSFILYFMFCVQTIAAWFQPLCTTTLHTKFIWEISWIELTCKSWEIILLSGSVKWISVRSSGKTLWWISGFPSGVVPWVAACFCWVCRSELFSGVRNYVFHERQLNAGLLVVMATVAHHHGRASNNWAYRWPMFPSHEVC
jgi:hypothetical protein